MTAPVVIVSAMTFVIMSSDLRAGQASSRERAAGNAPAEACAAAVQVEGIVEALYLCLISKSDKRDMALTACTVLTL